MKIMAGTQSPKTKRLSTVALSGAVLAVVWSVFDAFATATVPPVVVSSITSLVMLVAGFYDFKHKDDADTFQGEPE